MNDEIPTTFASLYFSWVRVPQTTLYNLYFKCNAENVRYDSEKYRVYFPLGNYAIANQIQTQCPTINCFGVPHFERLVRLSLNKLTETIPSHLRAMYGPEFISLCYNGRA